MVLQATVLYSTCSKESEPYLLYSCEVFVLSTGQCASFFSNCSLTLSMQSFLLHLSVVLTLLSRACAYASDIFEAQDFYSQPKDLIDAKNIICVSPLPVYPSWSGKPLVYSDCKKAWTRLFLRVGPQSQQQREFTYWFQDPPPKDPLSHKTPFGEIEGTTAAGRLGI